MAVSETNADAGPAIEPDSGVRPAPRSFRGILGSLGPGLIISASIVGSGELIVTTKLGSEVGFSLLWFIIAGCLLKVFLQIEWGRFVLGSGKSTLQVLQSLPGPKLGFSWWNWCWLVMFVATFFQVAGMLGGVAELLVEMGAPGSRVFWSVATALSCMGLLIFGWYSVIEKTSTVFVALFTLFTVASVIGLAWTPYAVTAADVGSGLSGRLPENFAVAFAAFGVIGVGASELLYYPYWCLEKGYARFVGPEDGTEAWKERAKGWLRVLKWDAWASMIIYTLATVAFYLLGAAVLKRQGLKVSNEEMIPTLSRLYTETFGSVGYWAFGIGAFAVLFSTIYIATASNTRLIADVGSVFGWLGRGPGAAKARVKWIRTAAIVLPVIYLVLNVWMKAPVSMVMVGALAQAAMLPLLAWALWGLRGRIPEVMRSGAGWSAVLMVSTLACTALGVWNICELFRK